jgi:hypothetical protein
MATRTPVAQAPALPTRQQWADWVNHQIAAHPGWIPPVQLCQEDIADWNALKDELERVKNSEMLLRQKIFNYLFPNPREGANAVRMLDGTVITATHVIARKVDEEKLATFQQYRICDVAQWLESLKIDVAGKDPNMTVVELLGLHIDELIKAKPELVTKEYRTLTAEQMALFEYVLDIKPGSPQVKITKAA